MAIQWSAAGEYMEACSCDFLCPCIPKNATTPATHDFCKVALTFEIGNGQFGDVPLKGVRFAMIAQSKAIMSQGGWIAGLVIDPGATEAQVNAVAAIATAAGGGPLGAFAPLISDFRGIERLPIEFQVDGHRRSVRIPGVLEQSIEGVASHTVPGECVVIDNASHPVNKRLNLATALKSVIRCFGIEWTAAPDRTNGHFAPFNWHGRAA
ncbi:MAG: DUF1326 domain-containing protein [Nevskia sp.]|nr:DUF1326 domain-containing protein [Nevskia sp.]